MSRLELPQSELIRVDSIIVKERLRPLHDGAVQELINSIREIGLIHPITIRRVNGRLVPQLVSGAHRLAACKALGYEAIPCNVTAGDDQDRADLMEIDENLSRNELSPAERAIHVSRRKEIYERLHPVTKHGGAPGKAGGGKIAKEENFSSFADDTAAKSGRTERSVRQDSTRAKHIPQIASVIGTSLDKGDELDALAKMTPAKQRPIIEQAMTGAKVSAKGEAKKSARAERETDLAAATVAASEALGTKLYGVIYADPPWRFEPYSRDTGMDRAADNHYPTMTTEDICGMDIPAADDCALFLWATAPMLPQALSVMQAWGFSYKSHWIWLKDKIGTGYWGRNKHELLLIGTRGSPPAPAPGEQPDSVILASLAGHSVKPPHFAEMIEHMFPHAALLEMFARSPRLGWDVWGNQTDLGV
jgi:N6-adenosine-specific RNA methylase IME4